MPWSSKTVATPGTAVALVSSGTLVTRVKIQAKKVTGGNSTPIFLGDDTVHHTTKQLFQLGLNEILDIVFAGKFDLASLFIDSATAGDGVVFWYQE